MCSNIPSLEDVQGELLQKKATETTEEVIPIVSVVTVCFNPLKAGRRELFAQNLDSGI